MGEGLEDVDPRTARAISIWRLRGRTPFEFVRFYAPEVLFAEHAALGRLVPLAAAGGARVTASVPRLDGLDHLEPLRRLGVPDGPEIDAAIALLRRARRTPYELDAADAVLGARGPVAPALRVQADSVASFLSALRLCGCQVTTSVRWAAWSRLEGALGCSLRA